MRKKFNTTGTCYPEDHYMADVSKKMNRIYRMVEEGDYFIINRPRQYGKTTTLHTIAHHFTNSEGYLVFNISFEGIGDVIFEEEHRFAAGFLRILGNYAEYGAPQLAKWLHETALTVDSFETLGKAITLLSRKIDDKLILLIDEVDKSSNNQLFVSFLAMLRNKFLMRKELKTFHAVILAGVHDVKSLKLKLRPNEEQKLNSPWNIAADFKVDMNLYPDEIKPMLADYSDETGVKMDMEHIAERLFYYTSGYPYLVSRLCKILDEDILLEKTEQTWTTDDLDKAARLLISESNSNFDSMIKNLENNEELYQQVYIVAIENQRLTFNIHNPLTNLGALYGIFVNKNGIIGIHNRIYNEVLVNYMTDGMHILQLSKGVDFGSGYKNSDRTLNMEKVMLGFQAFMKKEYNKKDRDFLEKNGRLVFLAFVKPIINGSGYDFKETQISEERRLDVVLTYFEHKYVAELKIWRGEKAHEKGLLQLSEYLDNQGLTEGYLLIFDHSDIKHWQSEWTVVEGKKVFAVWV